MITIVGGGPAGATLALRLRRLGHAVTIIERGGRANDGESLNPGIWPLLDALGIDAGGLRIHRSLIRWNGDDVVEKQHRIPQLAVMRATFDAQLIDMARAAGAVVCRTGDPAGPIVVDASGRASWSRGSRRRTSEPKIAMRAIWRGAGLPSEARVEALDEGWLWGSPMPDGSFAAMASVDAPADYFAMLEKSRLFRDLRGDAAVHHCDATTYAADVVCDERLIRVGDASHTLDPLSSSGVRSAMQSALHASIVINTMIRRPHDAPLALQFYRDAQSAAVAQHLEWTRAFYRNAGDLAGWPAGVPPASVTLAPDIAIDEVPCIIGDFIERRRGITGSALARPFVWIGGVEAAPLLEPLTRDAMPRERLLAHWHSLAPGREHALFDQLVRTGVLTAGESHE